MNVIRRNVFWIYAGVGVFAIFILLPLLSQAQTPGSAPGYNPSIDPSPGTTACTRDAMQCPDGTYVGRTGPNCEFVCPGDTPFAPPSVDFSASPQSGSAPLTVNFSASLTEPQYYSVNFGDRTSGTFSRCAESYPSQCSLSHTYRANGTYTAELVYDLCGLSTGTVRCMAPVQVVASVTIRIGNNLPGVTPGSGADGDVAVSNENPNPDDTYNYWTPERMRDAQALEMGVYVEDSSNQSWLNRLSALVSNLFRFWSFW